MTENREVDRSEQDNPRPLVPGTPEFIAAIEKHKDYIEATTGVRPRYILDIGVGDMPGYSSEPEPDDPR